MGLATIMTVLAGSIGRLVAKRVPEFDAGFYLCGSNGLMALVQEHLEARQVLRERIRSEVF
jgi:ferredoxin-NADP reductase